MTPLQTIYRAYQTSSCVSFYWPRSLGVQHTCQAGWRPALAHSLTATRAMGKRKSQQDNTPPPEESLPANGKVKASRAKKAKAEVDIAPGRPVYSDALRKDKLQEPKFTMLSWNINSLNSTLQKEPDSIRKLVEAEQADVLCLQETKLQSKNAKAMEDRMKLPGWHFHWNCSEEKKGYSGTLIASRTRPLKVTEGIGHANHDAEGRVITAEYSNLHLVTAYVPNAGEGLKRLDYRVQEWDAAFAGYLAQLAETKPVVLAGDLNCAHQEIDIHSPKTNKKQAGFTDEERESFGRQLLGIGLKDVFRRQHPDVTGYTYWNYYTKARDRNAGWRIDYFLVSDALADQETIHDAFHLPAWMGSDHCPIGLTLKIGSA